jgi:hypothetical protein
MYILESARMRFFEKTLYNAATQIVVLSEKDKQIIVSEFCVPQQFINVQFPESTIHIHEPVSTPVPGRIVLWGNFKRYENLDSLVYFMKEIFPQIKCDVPAATVYAVGVPPAHPPTYPDLLWCGFAVDPCAEIQTGEIGVVPLRYGAGVKLKTIEMAAAGLQLVSTEIGAEGTPPNSKVMIATNDKVFAAECVRLLTKQRCVI